MSVAVRVRRYCIRPSTASQILRQVLAVEHIFDAAAGRLLDPFLSTTNSVIGHSMLAGGDARDHDGGRVAV